MHALIKPQMVIPMHGEYRHLRENAKLAQSNGIASVIAANGSVVDLTGDQPKIVEHVETARTYLDGDIQIGQFDGGVRDRIRMGRNGHALVTLILEGNEPLGDPWVEVSGLPETGRSKAPLVDVLEEDLGQFIGRAKRQTLSDDEALEKELRNIVRRSSDDEIGKKPEVTLLVSRLMAE